MERRGPNSAEASAPGIDSASSRPGERGVILLDVVLTLTIFLLAVRVIWPLLPVATSPARLGAYAQQIASLLEADRIVAARTGRVVTTRIDVRARTFLGGASGWVVTLPSDVVLDVTTTEDCTLDPGRFAIGFRPDGRSCGLLVGLAGPGRTAGVLVNWLTGLVEVTGGARGRG